jgi:hypothetical protein
MKFLCAIIALLTSPLYAGTFYTAERVRAPDHLTPLDFPPDDYDALIVQRLCHSGGFITFVERPSFDPESCLVIYENIPKEAEQKHGGHWMVPDEEKKYFIVARRAKQSLYYSMAQNNDEKADKTVEISESRREISLELAASIHRAWTRMLLQTRYPAGAVLGLDGTTLQFSAWAKGLGTLHGETWSPKAGLTAELAALGQALVNFTEHPGVEAAPLTQRLHDFEAKVAGLQGR